MIKSGPSNGPHCGVIPAMRNLLFLVSLLPGLASADCLLEWDYPDTPWIEGFRFYQGGTVVGGAVATVRSATCDEAGLVPGPGAITMTAYRGTDESEQSAPAIFELAAPGVRVRIEVH